MKSRIPALRLRIFRGLVCKFRGEIIDTPINLQGGSSFFLAVLQYTMPNSWRNPGLNHSCCNLLPEAWFSAWVGQISLDRMDRRQVYQMVLTVLGLDHRVGVVGKIYMGNYTAGWLVFYPQVAWGFRCQFSHPILWLVFCDNCCGTSTPLRVVCPAGKKQSKLGSPKYRESKISKMVIPYKQPKSMNGQ